MKNPVPEDQVLLILGSLNAKREDRNLPRTAVKPVQGLYDGEIVALEYFNGWGELGLSAMAWRNVDLNTLYLTTGAELIALDLKKKSWIDLHVNGLLDVHELTCIHDEIWLANTGHNEIVVYGIADKAVKNRIKLSTYGKQTVLKRIFRRGELKAEIVGTFHGNQAFKGYDGHIYVLVHHVTGQQIIKKMKQKFVKSQGDGGVIDITTGKCMPLRLKAPHSVRQLHDQYWVLDSGHSSLNLYDRHWNLQHSLTTKGWGRGAAFSPDEDLFCAGISARRKRYLDLIPGRKQNPNMIQFFDVISLQSKGEAVIPNVEQINNIYLLQREQFKRMLALN